jgi:hypothetical protein
MPKVRIYISHPDEGTIEVEMQSETDSFDYLAVQAMAIADKLVTGLEQESAKQPTR